MLADDLTINHSNQVFFDLLYNAMKEDYSIPRIKAFLKRLMQVAVHAEPPFLISSLLLLARMLQTHPGAKSLLNFSDQNKLDLDDEEEVFKDVPDEDDGIVEEQPQGIQMAKENALLLSNDLKQKKFSTEYDPYKREPLYANAESSFLFEVLMLKQHYHPTVKLYANAIVEDVNKNAKLFDYQGNALLDFSLSNFLDRISFKKPKKTYGNKANKMRMSKLVAPISDTVIIISLLIIS